MLQTLRETIDLADSDILEDKYMREGLNMGFNIIKKEAQEERSPSYGLRDYIQKTTNELNRLTGQLEGLKAAKLIFELRQRIIFIGKDETKKGNIG